MQHHDSDEAKRFAREQEEIRVLLPAVALGVATSVEYARVETLLRDDPEAAREVADYHALIEGMLLNTPAVEPPAVGLERLLAAIPLAVEAEQTPQLAAVEAQTNAESKTAANASVLGGFFSPRWRVSLAAVAAALVVALGLIGYLATQLTATQSDYQQLLAAIREQDQALMLMREEDVGWVKLNNPDGETETSPYAWMIYSPGEQSGVILTNNFPELQPNMAYQLWAARDDYRVSLGTFQTRNDGTAYYRFWLPEDITDFQRMGITTEPEEGSPGPTTPAVVRIDLTQFNERIAEA